MVVSYGNFWQKFIFESHCYLLYYRNLNDLLSIANKNAYKQVQQGSRKAEVFSLKNNMKV